MPARGVGAEGKRCRATVPPRAWRVGWKNIKSCWPTLKSLSHNIIHLFVLKLQSNRHSRIFPKCYVGGRIFSKAYKIVRRTTTCSHGSLHSQLNRTGLHFTAKGDGAAAQRSVPSMHRQRRARRPRKKSTTARQFHEHDGSSICHHKGLRTATAKSYSPPGRAGGWNERALRSESPCHRTWYSKRIHENWKFATC